MLGSAQSPPPDVVNAPNWSISVAMESVFCTVPESARGQPSHAGQYVTVIHGTQLYRDRYIG